MNDDKLKGQWKQLAGRVTAQWGRMTANDAKVAQGTSAYLEGLIQERYGIACEAAERRLRAFSQRI